MGLMLESYASQGHDVDLVVRKQIGLELSLPRDDRPSLVFARRATRCKAVVEDRPPLTLTSSTLFLAPPGSRVDLRGDSTVSHVVVLRPSAARVREAAIENGLEASQSARAFDALHRLRLSRWMDDLVDRYDFEARLNTRTPAQCPFFLEKQILNECVRLTLPDAVPTTGELVGEVSSDLVARALAFLDGHAFEELTSDSLAAALRCSPSQLNKCFQDELGTSPTSYVVQLRLELAAVHLERGEWTAQDLSTLCGFSDLSAFSRAFKRKFGVPPSRYRASVLGS